MSEFDFIDDYAEPQANLETLSDNVAESAINVAFIGVGGTMMMCNTLRKLYWGVGKIVLKDE